MATKPASVAVVEVEKLKVDPQLKPYHPNQRKKVPKTQNGML